MKISNNIFFKGQAATVILVLFIFGFFFVKHQVAIGQSFLPDLIQEMGTTSSEKFIDNDDNSVTDWGSKLTWMKCDYGQYGINCLNGTSTPQSVGYNSVDTCYENESFMNACQNGVLCKDGHFVTADLGQGDNSDISEGDTVTENNILKNSCFVKVSNSAKDKACEKHGGVSKYEWEVPTEQEIKTLYDNTKKPNNIDSTFFPKSQGKYLIENSVNQGGGSGDTQLVYNFANNGIESTALSAPLKCVSRANNQIEIVGKNDDGILLAVTLPGYDNMGKIIKDIGIPFDVVEKFESLSDMKKYDAIFINCGSSLYVKDEQAIKEYVKSGGSIYLSDWSAAFLNEHFPEIEFTHEKAGEISDVVAKVVNPGLRAFLGKGAINVKFDAGAWEIIEEIDKKAEVYITGPVSGSFSDRPFVFTIQYGKGHILYTSFHNEAQVDSDVKKMLEWFVLKNAYWKITSETRDKIGDKNNLLEIVDIVKSGDKKEYKIKLNKNKEIEIVVNAESESPVNFVLKDSKGVEIIKKTDIKEMYLGNLSSEGGSYDLIIEPTYEKDEIAPFVVIVTGDEDSLAGPGFIEKLHDSALTIKNLINDTVLIIEKVMNDTVPISKKVTVVFLIAHAGSYLMYDKIILKNPNPILNRMYAFLKDITKSVINSAKKLFNKG